jgi:hypothetical protein
LKLNLDQEMSRLKVYTILAILVIPPFLYDCEIWTLTQRDIRKLTTAEMKFMQHTAEYKLLDYGGN